MTKPRNKKQAGDTEVQQVVEQPQHVKQSCDYLGQSDRKLSVFEKATIMNDLANIIRDQEFIKILKGKPSGEFIYGLFHQALEQALQKMMGVTEEIVEQQIDRAALLIEASDLAINSLKRMVTWIEGTAQTPLITALQMLSNSIGDTAEKVLEREDSKRGYPSYQQEPQNAKIPNDVRSKVRASLQNRKRNVIDVGILDGGYELLDPLEKVDGSEFNLYK